MSLDTNKPVESITYNGVAFPLASTGGATTASEVSYTNANLEGVTNAQGALDALVDSKTQAETDIETLGSAIDSMDTKVTKNTTDISTLTSNQETLTQNVNTLNTQYTALNEKAHTHSNKDVLDLFSQSTSFVKYNDKDLEEKVTINEEDNTTIELTNNTDFLRDEVASLTISFPGGLSLGTPFYRSSLSFKSGSTATAITYPTGIIWSGFDIKNGQFVPVAGKYYNIVFWRDYFGYNAVVRGVWV